MRTSVIIYLNNFILNFWKTKEEADAMTDIKAKVNLAQEAGASITIEQFREDMPVIIGMLGKAIEFAYEQIDSKSA